MDVLVTALKTLGHPQRLRIMALLARGELTISELVQITGLSQPRITQYVQSLETAGLAERIKEGSWVFSRLRRNQAETGPLIKTILKLLLAQDDRLAADVRRLTEVRAERAAIANAYFAKLASDGGQMDEDYALQAGVEAELSVLLGERRFEHLVDLGTGTGRLLSVLSAYIDRGTGVDSNMDMLKLARHNLAQDGHDHISVRHGDLLAAPFSGGCADLVSLHQVLHYLDDPFNAIEEMARLCKGGGSVLIIDYAAHDFDEFRDKFAHRRLGFSDQVMQDFLAAASLKLSDIVTVEASTVRPDIKIWHAKKL